MDTEKSEPQMGFEPTTLRALDRILCVLLWPILYISLYFFHNTNIICIGWLTNCAQYFTVSWIIYAVQDVSGLWVWKNPLM